MAASSPSWIAVELLVGIATVIHGFQYVREGVEWYKRRRLKPRHKRKHKPAKPHETPKQRDYLFGIFYALLCGILWSVSYVSLSYVTARADPVEINVVLLGSATFFLFLGFVFLRAIRREQTVMPISWRTWNPWLIAIANLLSFIFFIYALRFVSASQTITLSKINPLFIALFSWIILRQRPPPSTVSAAFLVVLGTVLITANEKFTFEATSEVVGSLLAILAGLGFALFSIGLERVEREHTGLSERLLFLAVVFFLSYVGIVTVAHFEGLKSSIDAESMVILLLNGLRAAVVYALYQAAVRRIGALRVSVLVALEVPFTMFWDTAWLGRVPAARLIWGSLTILFAALTLGWDMLRAKERRGNATQTSAAAH